MPSETLICEPGVWGLLGASEAITFIDKKGYGLSPYNVEVCA